MELFRRTKRKTCYRFQSNKRKGANLDIKQASIKIQKTPAEKIGESEKARNNI